MDIDKNVVTELKSYYSITHAHIKNRYLYIYCDNEDSKNVFLTSCNLNGVYTISGQAFCFKEDIVGKNCVVLRLLKKNKIKEYNNAIWTQ